MKTIHVQFLALFFALVAFGPVSAQTATTHGSGKQAPPSDVHLTPEQAAVVKSIEQNMITVEGGNFSMGCANASDTECVGWERPRHTVTIGTFHMCKFDVTQKEWKAVMGKAAPGKFCADCPVVNVSWSEAREFVDRLNQLTGKNYRLPTEAEWEYAAKGGNKSHGFKYAGDNEAATVAWYDTLITHNIRPVGGKKPNELGLYDMSGNVWQWCSDWWDEKYYTGSPSNNPQGPAGPVGATAHANRSLRGGSWWGPMRDCRVSNRDKFPFDSKDDDVGFRLAAK